MCKTINRRRQSRGPSTTDPKKEMSRGHCRDFNDTRPIRTLQLWYLRSKTSLGAPSKPISLIDVNRHQSY